MSNNPNYPFDYSFYRGGKPLHLPDQGFHYYRKERPSDFTPLPSNSNTNTNIQLPYEHFNPFSPKNVFPKYGWYDTSTPQGSAFSQPTSNLDQYQSGFQNKVSSSTKIPYIFPNTEEYQMYTNHPSLLPKSYQGGSIPNPTITEDETKKVYKPFGEKSNLYWTSPKTGKSYQLPPSTSKYRTKHRYICEYCQSRKMDIDAYTWCGNCRDYTKNVVIFD
ncbi:uncharacterized protein L201_008088 [Kwoniella dendrophila CBS 6074]|uniref:GATA-type domain-containing protein n=1 Tax=Kwoniella dendrophila CBS 6074 TaxID=1295534 RepID=A0AAX4K5Z2_9TREE